MLLKLPFFFDCNVQQDTSIHCVGFHDVEIPYIKRAEVELVARWFARDDAVIECISWRGSLYMPTVTDQGKRVTSRDLAAIRFGLPTSIPTATAYYQSPSRDQTRVVLLREWLTLNSSLRHEEPDHGTTRIEDIAWLEYLAGRTLIVDGLVYQKASNIHCVVYREYATGRSYRVKSAIDYSKNEGMSWANSERPFNWKSDFRISLNEVAGRQALDRPVSGTFHGLQLFDGGRLEFDTRRRYLKRFQKEIYRQTIGVDNAWVLDALSELRIVKAASQSGHEWRVRRGIETLNQLSQQPIGHIGQQLLRDGIYGWRRMNELLLQNSAASIQSNCQAA
ncbi:hypothetical protein [Rhizobium sp. BK176]|uniref:hypothetical protein n=1 Tax=Rhizobium sp. BK176 TaxID=2587071 RepID=UPI00216A626A|nr:hypothetical protein [Rhizobium sp. BK176]MCS4089189.1 hypothetical protein [Rhizobium sp. BK176]